MNSNTTHPQDPNLSLIEQELRFIARHSQTIEGGCGADFEAIDEINLAVVSALHALEEFRQTLPTFAPVATQQHDSNQHAAAY